METIHSVVRKLDRSGKVGKYVDWERTMRRDKVTGQLFRKFTSGDHGWNKAELINPLDIEYRWVNQKKGIQKHCNVAIPGVLFFCQVFGLSNQVIKIHIIITDRSTLPMKPSNLSAFAGRKGLEVVEPAWRPVLPGAYGLPQGLLRKGPGAMGRSQQMGPLKNYMFQTMTDIV